MKKIKQTQKITTTELDKIFDLKKKGLSLYDIAKVVDLTAEGVRYHLKKYVPVDKCS